MEHENEKGKDTPQRLETPPEFWRGPFKPNRTAIGAAGQGRILTIEGAIEELFTYHPVPDEATRLKYEMLRDQAKGLARTIIKVCPEGADRTAAIRKLREAVMTANAAIALNGLSL